MLATALNFNQITDKILNHLNSTERLPHLEHFSVIGLPKNFVSGAEYSGKNRISLTSRKFISPWFLTFLQAKELGGRVISGEKGTRIIKFGKANKDSTQEDDREKGYIKHYSVFNSSQIEGIEFPTITAPHPENREKTLKAPESTLKRMKSEVKIFEGRKAYPLYSRRVDEIDMPGREFFNDLRYYYHTLFHEMIHATGNVDRLARVSLLRSGKKGDAFVAYAKEELVAELGAAYLSAETGIVVNDYKESASYIQGWLQAAKIEESEDTVREAASEAIRAVNWITGSPQGLNV